MSTAQALAERDDNAVATHPASDSGALIAMIERVALNPSIDINKMERLLEMQERILARNAKVAFSAALATMQPELPVIERKGLIKVPARDGKTGHETPYALWEDINEAIRPLLSKYGFALSFRIKKSDDRVEVTGVLSHREGHSEETMLSLPMDTTGSKNNVQAIGSSVSYGKRYTAAALLNLTSRGEDDDGKAGGAANVETITEKQVMDIHDMLEATATNPPRFLAHFKIEALPDLPAGRYDEAVALLKRKQAK